MKSIVKIFFVATMGATMTTSCIKEIDPQTSYVTSDQASNAPGAFDNFVTTIKIGRAHV